jgi:hypothetical protein
MGSTWLDDICFLFDIRSIPLGAGVDDFRLTFLHFRFEMISQRMLVTSS